ncbi:MAG: hypothetical protein J5903_04370, partial [Clostridia bacterium]|nr:hypothetical protein [Clostridia bacterium]
DAATVEAALYAGKDGVLTDEEKAAYVNTLDAAIIEDALYGVNDAEKDGDADDEEKAQYIEATDFNVADVENVLYADKDGVLTDEETADYIEIIGIAAIEEILYPGEADGILTEYELDTTIETWAVETATCAFNIINDGSGSMHSLTGDDKENYDLIYGYLVEPATFAAEICQLVHKILPVDTLNYGDYATVTEMWETYNSVENAKFRRFINLNSSNADMLVSAKEKVDDIYAKVVTANEKIAAIVNYEKGVTTFAASKASVDAATEALTAVYGTEISEFDANFKNYIDGYDDIYVAAINANTTIQASIDAVTASVGALYTKYEAGKRLSLEADIATTEAAYAAFDDAELQGLVTDYARVQTMKDGITTEKGLINAAKEANDAIGEVFYDADSLARIENAETKYAALQEETKTTEAYQALYDYALMVSARAAYNKLDSDFTNAKNYMVLAATEDFDEYYYACSECYTDLRDSNSWNIFRPLLEGADISVEFEGHTYNNYIDLYGALSARSTEDLLAARKVVNEIKDVQIPEHSEEHLEKLVAAREDYEALTSGQKKLVDNYEDLPKAEAAYIDLLISEIENVEATEEYRENLVAARDAYDGASDEVKGYVQNLAILEAAEAAFAALLEDLPEFNDLVDTLDENAVDLSAEYKEKIDAVQAYLDEMKALYPDVENILSAHDDYKDNYEKWTNVLEAREGLIDDIEEAIDEIEFPVTFASKTAIDAANALIEEYAVADESEITNIQTLKTAEADYANFSVILNGKMYEVYALYKGDAAVAMPEGSDAKEQIEELLAGCVVPEVSLTSIYALDLDAANAVKQDLTAYDDDAEAKAYVKVAEDKLDEMIAAAEASALLVKESIAGFDLPYNELYVISVDEAYKALTDTQKALVDNYDVILEAYAEIEEKRSGCEGSIGGSTVLVLLAFVALVALKRAKRA